MKQWATVTAILAVALGAGAWYGARQPAPPPVAVISAPSPERVTVHVAGAVVRPGLVEVAAGSRVADAVAAAGGLTAEAAAAAVNLAALVRDGDQLIVPSVVEDDPSAPAIAGDGRIRLNSASQQALEALPGIGPVMAARIVAHREERGPYRSLEDLLDVPGIGEAKLAALRDLVVAP